MPATHPTKTVVERLGSVLNALLMDVYGRVAWGGIAMVLNVFISTRIIGHRQRIYDIVDRIRAGTYLPRRRPAASAAPSPPERPPRPPRPPGPVRQSLGWLLPLIPPYWQANGYRSALESLLAEPEMVALIEAAPVALGRPLRSLCWMLGLKRPPVLAPPRRRSRRPETSPPPSPPPGTPQAPAAFAPPPPTSAPPTSAPPPSPPQAPPARRPSRRRKAFALPPSACGPPHPA
jgi:hypothetical protein